MSYFRTDKFDFVFMYEDLLFPVKYLGSDYQSIKRFYIYKIEDSYRQGTYETLYFIKTY